MHTERPLRKPPESDSDSPPPTVAAATGPASDVGARVTELQAEFKLLKAQVRQAQQLAGLGTAAALIAHEVNNLLTPMFAYAKAALEANDPDLQRKALEVTVKNSETLVAMSQRVLELGAAKPAKRETVRVRSAVDDGLEGLCRDPAKDGIRFICEVDDSITVWADPLQLTQVFFNLFLNAREAMAPSHSGRLKVTATQRAKQVVIEVNNSGAPIPPDLLPRLFEPFQTSKPVTRNGRPRCGGLGLALCRDLVEENGGTIGVTSDSEHGTTFTLALPAERNDQQD